MVGQHELPKTGGLIRGSLYDFAKFCALIAFPAFAAAYFGLAGIWGLPHAQEIVGSVTVVDTFLGVVLGISKSAYNRSGVAYDGSVELVPDEANETTNLKFKFDSAGLDKKKHVLLQVNQPKTP